MHGYDNPQCKSLTEFEEDLQKFVSIKKALNKEDHNPRMVLNYIITLFNVFEWDVCVKLLFMRIDKEKWPELKTYLVFLNFMAEEIIDLDVKSVNIPLNQRIVDELRKL
jgi:hypothetical protein